MTDFDANIVLLEFSLSVGDGWPPVAVETLPFECKLGRYKLLAPSLFVSGLSVGDELDVSLEPGTFRVMSWSHGLKSGRSTVWLLRMHESETIRHVLCLLRDIGCHTVSLAKLGAYSVDVPEDVPIDRVDSALLGLDPVSVAAAFPSLRHVLSSATSGRRSDIDRICHQRKSPRNPKGPTCLEAAN